MNQRQMRNRIRIVESAIAALEYFAEEIEANKSLQLDGDSLMRLVRAGQRLDRAYKARRKACGQNPNGHMIMGADDNIVIAPK